MTFLAREAGRQHKAPCGAQRNAGNSGPVRRKPAKRAAAVTQPAAVARFTGWKASFLRATPRLASHRTGHNGRRPPSRAEIRLNSAIVEKFLPLIRIINKPSYLALLV